jgi:hypothetical protein
LQQLIDSMPKPGADEAAPPLPALTLREIVLEPGLRLVAEENWKPLDEATLENRFRAAVSALRKGGKR